MESVSGTIRIQGNSMFPTIPHGSLVRLRPLQENEPKLGQVVLFQQSEMWILHRVMYNSSRFLVTKGDASCRFDLPLQKNEVVATVREVILSPSWSTWKFLKNRSTLSFYLVLLTWPIAIFYANLDAIITQYLAHD